MTSRVDAGDAGTWSAAFAIVLYLALSGGGYDPLVHDEAGIAVWWIVLGGVATGVLTVSFGARSWAAIGLLGAFVAWLALATTWTESVERTGAELARAATYLGVLVLGLLLGRRPRAIVAGVGCGVAVVALLAVLSRLQPGAFPANDHAQFLPEALNRLSYPLNSWNGLASFVAIGVPILLGLAVHARTRAGQALSAAALPLMALCIFLTASRGGVVSVAVGVIAALLLFGDRVALLGTLLSTGAGAAVLITAAAQRDALELGAGGALAEAQGDDLLLIALITCAGVGLLQVAIGLAARFARRPAWMTPSPRATLGIGAAAVTVVAAVALAAGAAGTVERAFDDFRAAPAQIGTPGTPLAPHQSVTQRLETISGNGRWQYWKASVDAMQTAPLTGIGPGTFEFWWARHGTLNAFVRDAHSLYFETLGEAGIVGLLLLVGFLLLAVGAGVRRTRATRDSDDRMPLAAATAALLVFMVAASVDWVWELAVVPAAVMLLAGAVLAGGARSRGRGAAVVLALVSVGALVAIAIPLAGTSAVRRSQDAVRAGEIQSALGEARTAERAQPYAATPPLQRALVLELAGDHTASVAAAREATADEPTNWRNWFVRARMEARVGNAGEAVASYRRARELNPRSPVVQP